MAGNLATTVGQFHIANGLWQESAENLRVVEPRPLLGLGRRVDRMYILLETVGSFPHPDVVCGRIADTIEQTYYRNRGSITAKLWAALKAANRDLFERNLEAPTGERGVVGITCALLRGDDVYVMQAGPALLYTVQGDVVERFPSRSPWLNRQMPSLQDARQATALGWRRDIEPDLYHIQVEPGDMLAITSTHLVRLASDAQIVQSLANQDASGARQNLVRLGRDRDLSGIAVHLLPPGSPSNRAAVPLPQGDAAPQPTGAEGAHDARLDLVQAEIEAGDSMDDLSTWPEAAESRAVDWQPEAEWAETWDDLDDQTEDEYSAEQISLPWANEEGIRRQPVDWGQRAASAMASVGRVLSTLGQGVLPERDNTPRRRPPPEDRGTRAWEGLPIGRLALAAVIILPLMIGGFFIWRGYRDRRAHEAWVDGTLSQAKSQLETLRREEPDVQRAQLGTAIVSVGEVLAKEPENRLAQALQVSMTQQLDLVNRVVRVGHTFSLKDFDDEASGAPTRFLIDGPDIFTLDPEIPRVCAFSFDGSGEALKSQTPELVYPSSLTPDVSPNRQLAAMSAALDSMNEQAPRLLILTADGVILQTTRGSNGLTARGLENAEALRSPQAIETYGTSPGMFAYVLDPRANLIRKYQYFGHDYTDQPHDYPLTGENVDLLQAVDMAIDGNIYVLLRTGQIIKLSQGKAVDFGLGGLDEPLKDPVAISLSNLTEMEAGGVYIADAGNQRIVEFDKFGYFVRQFRPTAEEPPWDQLRDIWADALAQRLYILNGSALRYLDLP